MSFRLLYEKRFSDDLRKLQTQDKALVRKKLEWLKDNVIEAKHTRLKGQEFKGVYRLRITNWRVFYRLDFKQKTIYVLSIKDRKEAYKQKK